MAEVEDPVFKSGETVLSFHGPLLYESKVLSSEVRADAAGEMVMMYLNHYKGWNRSWDEWIPADRIKKMNDTNLELQKSLVELSSSKKLGKRSSDKHDKIAENTSKKRRGADQSNTEESTTLVSIDMKILLPDDLKILLVEDWHNVVTKKMVWKLPCSVTISEILAEYRNQVQGVKAKSVATEVCSGLKLYFEHGCGPLLLYKQERPQFDELVAENEDVELCTKYGVVHLLRLFIKIGSMMQSAGVGIKGMIYLVKCFQDILRYIKDYHIPQLTTDLYQTCSESYEDKLKSS